MSGSAPPQGRKARFPGSNLQLRIVSALVLGVVVLAVAWFGGMPFRILAAAMAAAIFYEWTAIAGTRRQGRLHVARALLVLTLAIMIAGLQAPLCLAALGFAFVVALCADLVTRAGTWTAPGLIYAGLPAIAASFLRGSDDAGLKAILFLFVVVWATDILAYFVGRAVGGPKLAPSISPGKTWSGAAGGAVGGIVAGLAFCAWAGSSRSTMAMAAVALLLSIVSQIGDLAESAFKRRFGVKDSGHIIPGHGGIMDRVDGLVAAAVLFYLMGALLSGWTTPSYAFFD